MFLIIWKNIQILKILVSYWGLKAVFTYRLGFVDQQDIWREFCHTSEGYQPYYIKQGMFPSTSRQSMNVDKNIG